MGRTGKQLIEIPSGVEVKIDQGFITVKGPMGELKQKINPLITVSLDDNLVRIRPQNEEIKKQQGLWGLFQRLIKNMVEGVTKGFEKKLELVGVGYRTQLSGNKLILNIGFSHPVDFLIPAGIKIDIDKNIVIIRGIDKQLVGDVAAQIRQIRKPDPYKGKGIKYLDEIIRKKAGKKAVTATK